MFYCADGPEKVWSPSLLGVDRCGIFRADKDTYYNQGDRQPIFGYIIHYIWLYISNKNANLVVKL